MPNNKKYRFYKNKNGGKLTNEALSHKGHSPSTDIKSNKGIKSKK